MPRRYRLFAYEFMVNAFLAATIVAVVAGAAGYFLVLRGQTFAGHALAHLGFTGATGAILIGAPPLWGLLAVTVAGAAGMGMLGERGGERDVAIGVVLALALGFGMLFLHFTTGQATRATALLFGNILGVDRGTIGTLLALGVAAMAALAAMARPLLFATLQPELAEARGVKLRLVSASFLAVVAVSVALSVQVVGVLLVFALLVAPAAAALRITGRLGAGLATAIALAVAQSWGGIALAYQTDWPVSFWITALGVAGYLAACAPPWRSQVTAAPSPRVLR